MKKVDMPTRALREHIANCLICTKIKDTTGFRGAELCDVGCALADELCDGITKDEPDAMLSGTAARIVRLWSGKIAYAVPTKKTQGFLRVCSIHVTMLRASPYLVDIEVGRFH
jgi:hypothetical protein